MDLNIIVEKELPGISFPTSFSISKNGIICFLSGNEGSLVKQLYSFNPQTGTQQLVFSADPEGCSEEKISAEEKLIRERLRLRSLGVTSFEWNPNGENLMIPLSTGIYLSNLSSSFFLCPIALSANFSPNGKYISYVKNNEIFVREISGEEKCRTIGKTGKRGISEFVAMEEMDRMKGMWWNHTGEKIAFCEVHEEMITDFLIVHHEENCNGSEKHGYPFAGKNNAIVKIGIISALGNDVRNNEEMKDVVWLKLECGSGNNEMEYIARVNWLQEELVVVQVMDRKQSKLTGYLFDAISGENMGVMFCDTTDVWINLDNVFENVGSGKIVRASETSGFKHLYLYNYLYDDDDKSAQSRRNRFPADDPRSRYPNVRFEDFPLHPSESITWGQWAVDDMVKYVPSTGDVYFLATAESPTERHLYRTKLQKNAPLDRPCPIEKLTEAPGMHTVTVDPLGRFFVDNYSNINTPNSVHIRRIPPSTTPNDAATSTAEAAATMPDFSKGDICLYRKDVDPALMSTINIPRIVSTSAQWDGSGTKLYSAIYTPRCAPFRSENGKFPVVIAVYGGPHVQRVLNDWGVTADGRAQVLADRGIVVIKTDNRGSYRRGLDFEKPVKHHMGDIEIADQLGALSEINRTVFNGMLDEDRVAIYGWSYGGYATLQALLRYPGRFRCGISGAPVTDWLGYDTCYTERYLGVPRPAGPSDIDYTNSSVLALLQVLTEIAQGKTDVNALEPFFQRSHVHFQLPGPDVTSTNLLLIHGAIDENVHLRHTMRLAALINTYNHALSRCATRVLPALNTDMLILRNERHLVRDPAERWNIEHRTLSFIYRHL